MKIDTTVQMISRRHVTMPVTEVLSDSAHPGLVLFAHGFKAERTEGGRFITVASTLADNGINSLTTDFPGCGESKEPFEQYTLTHCLEDLETLYAYAKEKYNLDTNRLGIVGYSMGGRLACIWVRRHPEFRVLGLWAAASYNDFGGTDEFLENPLGPIYESCAEKGYADIMNSFDHTDLRLSADLLKDMSAYKPFDDVTHYQGDVVLVHGTKDTMVDPKVSLDAYEHLTTTGKKKLIWIDGANHGFGLWDNHMEQSQILTDETTRFFQENL